jgi:acetyltransferase-like isoleucine patch superfamily enzyme
MIHEFAQVSGVKFWHDALSNIGQCTIGKGTIVHSHVWIGDRVKIGEDCRIQAFSFIPTNVRLGRKVFVGPRVTFTNDKHPPSDQWEITIVGDFVSIGAGAIILPGVTLGDGCTIGAGAVVTKSIPPGETWVGNPAKKHEDRT